jgi:hypothetical protein
MDSPTERIPAWSNNTAEIPAVQPKERFLNAEHLHVLAVCAVAGALIGGAAFQYAHMPAKPSATAVVAPSPAATPTRSYARPSPSATIPAVQAARRSPRAVVVRPLPVPSARSVGQERIGPLSPPAARPAAANAGSE